MGAVGSTLKKVGTDIGHGLQDVAHVGGDILKTADNAVVHVGDEAAHLVHYVPIVGSTLSKGIKGITDLQHLSDTALGDVVHYAAHPIDALEGAKNDIEHPLKTGKKIARLAQRTAGDVGNVAAAAKYVAPEFAPELNEVAAVANVIKHPTVKGVIGAAEKYVPKGSKLAKTIKMAKKAVAVGSKLHAGGMPYVGGKTTVCPTNESVVTYLKKAARGKKIVMDLYKKGKHLGKYKLE